MSRRSFLFLSHSNVFEHFKVGSHHYATELALLGNDVFHVSTPISVAHRLLNRAGSGSVQALKRGWITDDNGVHHLVPSSIIPAGLLSRTSSKVVRSLPVERFDVTLIDQPLLWSPAVRSVSRTLIYRPTDTYDDGRKRRLQDAAVAQSDGVVATSDEVLRSLNLPSNKPSLVLPNGVDFRHFSTPELPRRKTAVYVGALDSRLDLESLVQLARTFPDWSFDIYGPGEVAIRQIPANLMMRGAISYSQLPAVLASARIGLLPLTSAAVNAGRSPMKLYEYLASGVSVLSSATPTIRENTEARLLTYSNRDEMIEKFDALMSGPSLNEIGRSVASDHGWNIKAHQLLTFAEGL